MNGRDFGTQLRKGVVEGCVLAVVEREPTHGWELARVLQEHGLIGSVGTLYPVLTRLEKAGELASREVTAESGRRRRYYEITPAGRASLAQFTYQWQAFVGNVTAVLKESQ
ncbi:transcriptional regulator, PadR family [Ruaniaceae bacterium KH17]|nr:transcriptional regulator, PadR family [Ruaniaceae bacterium KH17]